MEFLRYFEIILWNWLEYFHKIFWKLKKNTGKVNFGLILGNLWRNINVPNFKLLILWKLRRILKMFLSSFSEIVKKSREYIVQIFRYSKRKFRDIFESIFGKLMKNYPKDMKLFWKNFGIIWRNYKIIILGIFRKFLGKYVH